MKARRVWDLGPRQAGVRLFIVLGLTILYVATFPFLVKAEGPATASLIALPVALAGWYFGVNAGLLASLLGIVLNTTLLTIFTGNLWSMWVVNYWGANSMVILIGYVAGRLRNEFAERTRILDELRSRERYLTLINLTTRDVLTPKNSKDRHIYLLNHLVNLFVADYAYLVRWDATRAQAVLVASTTSSEQPPSQFLLQTATIIVSALNTGRVQVVEDVPNLQHTADPSRVENFSLPLQSALGIPLTMGAQKLGVVIIAYETSHPFSTREINYAELVASQVALALWTAEQELQIQKQLKEARALANIERALSESEQVGIETVLQLIVDSAKELIPGAKQAILHLLDNEQQILVPRAVSGIEGEDAPRLNMHLGEGVAGQVILTREVIRVSDAQSDPRFLNQATPVKFRSLIVAPIKSNERCVGTISVQSERPDAFTSEEGQLLGKLGIHAAVAIENANLLETTQHDLKEINALYRLSQGLAASLDPDQLMKDVVDLLHKNFGYYHVQFFVKDFQSGDLVARRGAGVIGDQLRERGFRLPVGDGIVGHVAETGKPFVSNDVDSIIFFRRNPLLPDTQSELTVPIKIGNQVVGVLDIQRVPPEHLTLRDLKLMSAVADQLAVALQKANLYAELHTSLAQEKSMRTQLIQSERLAVVGRLLASVSHELNNPLQALQNALFLLKDEEKLSSQGQQDLEIILSETERMATLIERLRSAYRPTRTEDFQEVELNNIIENVYALTATHMRHKKINFSFHPDPELPMVSCVPDQIQQVMLNLIMNAVESNQTGGQITISTRQLPEEDKILLSVTDTGTGIDPKLLPHIFEPFVTGKETGTGLGLTITSDIIRHHDGDIQAENNPQGGATFKVWLPVKKMVENEHLRPHPDH